MILDRLTQLVRPTSPAQEGSRLIELRTELLLQKRWSYLRYVHLREGLLTALNDVGQDGSSEAQNSNRPIKRFLAVGAGRGLAELALAVEFPDIHFVITDIVSSRTPNYQAAQAFAAKWGLQNVEFSTLDVALPLQDRFDVIASTEVVEHIKDDETALQNMLNAANHSVYCLVPFADQKTLNDPRKQATAWERHEHYRYGYSAERFQELFPDIIEMRGCYWRERGFVHRTELGELSDVEIRKKQPQLASNALSDILNELPKELSDAQGIWVLARAPRPKVEAGSPLSGLAGQASDSAANRPGRLDTSEGQLEEIRKRLVFYRSWSYLRYVHLRQAFLETQNVQSFLSIGSGRGLAELALAIEFPNVRFLLTDIQAEATSSTEPALELARAWSVDNLSFQHFDILAPDPALNQPFDFVCSVEVLEHLKEDRRAVENMKQLSSRYCFCLVPFADRKTDADPTRRARAWEKDKHYRFGYSAGDLRSYFPGQSIIRGCYWREGVGPIPSKSGGLTDEALLSQALDRQHAAQQDIIDRIPERYPEALGIWILSDLAKQS